MQVHEFNKRVFPLTTVNFIDIKDEKTVAQKTIDKNFNDKIQIIGENQIVEFFAVIRNEGVEIDVLVLNITKQQRATLDAL